MSREQDDAVRVPDRADYDSPWKKALEVYFIDWIMALPKELEQGLWQEIHKIEEESRIDH